VASTLDRGAARAGGLAALVDRDRLFRARTRGLASLSAEHVHHLGLRGPTARASGLRDDARVGDPLYDRLGFETVVHDTGDAHARTVVRAHEAGRSLCFAAAALRAELGGTPAPPAFARATCEVEGPRGPLRAEHEGGPQGLAAPGAEAARWAAGEVMVGEEWAAALVALASFDLSPWRIGE
jgi:NADH-quinone oxidoreductase subunit D